MTDNEFRIEILSIDITNRCSKGCEFCYNNSHPSGTTEWSANEIITFAKDCIDNGVKAISLGGGEPFEHPEIFDIIKALQPLVYLSVTTNGLPLLRKEILQQLIQIKPDKIHISLHNPDSISELDRILSQIQIIETLDIKPGVNLLIRRDGINEAKRAYCKLRQRLSAQQIIILPMRFGNTPSAKEIASVTSREPFQSASCLLGCKRPHNFASVTYDKRAHSCSFTQDAIALSTLTYRGLIKALGEAHFNPCDSNVKNQAGSTS